MKVHCQIKRKAIGMVSAAIVVSVALTACGSSGAGTDVAAAGSVASGVDLRGVNITISSKETPQDLILGQLMIQALKASGADVKDQTGLAGTKVARAALTSGQVDAYPEYTGTGWLTILQETQPVNDPQQLFDAVKTADAKNNVSWFARAPLNDTYAVGATADAAKSTGVTSMSQYAALARTDPAKATICASGEFRTREDGLRGLEKTYGFTLPDPSIIEVETTIAFQAAKKGQCNFLQLASTDPQILSDHLTVLNDDKNFFPIYNPAVTMRSDLYTAHQAQYDKLLGPVMKLLTQDADLKLVSAVALDGLPADKVALDFLKQNGIV